MRHLGRKLQTINHIKVFCFKQALGLHLITRNRLAYLLADSPLLSKDLCCCFKFLVRETFKTNFKNWERKFADVGRNLFASGVMRNNECKGPNRPKNFEIIFINSRKSYNRLIDMAQSILSDSIYPPWYWNIVLSTCIYKVFGCY